MIDIITTSNNYWEKRHTNIISNLLVSFFYLQSPVFTEKSGTSIETLNFYNLYPIYMYNSTTRHLWNSYISILTKQNYCKNPKKYPETKVLQKSKVKKLLCSYLWVSLEKYDSSTEFIILFMTNIFVVRIFLIACLTNIFVVRSERVNQC